MNFLEPYRTAFEAYLEVYKNKERLPSSLYEPTNYILELGGKRLRPLLTLMAASYFSEDYKKALPAALAVEVFHNFSLIHDDIMDEAPLRRGKETVHEKWDLNTGILSGDAMLIMAYELFGSYEPSIFKKLVSLFTTTALEVCEGQQYDVDFEQRTVVEVPEYLKMITNKTAVLVATALKMGAIITGASQENANALYDFGKYLGIAFQLQDDYLDAFGNPETFGKIVGGDILENKKTYLVLKALELANAEDAAALRKAMTTDEKSEGKVTQVKAIFERSGADKVTQDTIAYYTEQAFNALEQLRIKNEYKNQLKEFGEYLMHRTS